MPTVDLPNGTIYYAETKNTGSPYPPVVLVHGAGGSHFDWAPELRRLANARVLALDLPGHGRSAGAGYDDTHAYANDIRTALNILGIDRAIVAGHSMGGAVAQQIGIHYSDCVAGLILLGTGSKLPIDPTLPQRILDETSQTVDWIIDWAWSAHAPQDLKALGRQRLSAVSPDILRSDYLACDAFDARNQLGRITVPTLVIGANEDRMVKLKFSTYLAEHIRQASLVVIEGAGHMFPLEKPQAVASAISEWLSEQQWTD